MGGCFFGISLRFSTSPTDFLNVTNFTSSVKELELLTGTGGAKLLFAFSESSSCRSGRCFDSLLTSNNAVSVRLLPVVATSSSSRFVITSDLLDKYFLSTGLFSLELVRTTSTNLPSPFCLLTRKGSVAAF